MIRIENFVGPSNDQWAAVIRGMRNPMNSWEKSDSGICEGEFVNTNEHASTTTSSRCKGCEYDGVFGYDASQPGCEALKGTVSVFRVGDRDMKLAKGLIAKGVADRKFLRQLPVIMDITAPLYWWRQMSTYKIGTVTDSCSQMHTLLKEPFHATDFSFEGVLGYKVSPEQAYPIYSDEELMKEEWVEIESGYKISSLGRIKNSQDYLMKPTEHHTGYLVVSLSGKQYRIHRLVAQAFIDNQENKPYVNHINGNKLDNRVSNLEWVTNQENINHAYSNNYFPTATRHHKGKLNDNDREQLKRDFDAGGFTKTQLAKKYGLELSTVIELLNGKHEYLDDCDVSQEFIVPTIELLNSLRERYFETSSEAKKKNIWNTILKILPQSFNQKRTFSANYEVLRNICHQREGHKLKEWADFIQWVRDNVPYAEELIF